MKEYVATFHTHLSAMLTCQALTQLAVQARMMPVPRRLSSSCGTCVWYRSTQPYPEEMDEDVEAIYEKIGREEYAPVMKKED